MQAQDIIKRPVLTEKASQMRESGDGSEGVRKIVFEVAKGANKVEIRKAVKTLFNVEVTAVHTQIVRGKIKRVGRFAGQTPHWKKAIVTLAPGQTIEFFEGV